MIPRGSVAALENTGRVRGEHLTGAEKEFGRPAAKQTSCNVRTVAGQMIILDPPLGRRLFPRGELQTPAIIRVHGGFPVILRENTPARQRPAKISGTAKICQQGFYEKRKNGRGVTLGKVAPR